MSVLVENLSKQYGAQMAVNGISFAANKGSIVGFLGPNGAGKTTTMKIITGYLPATSGTVKVCDIDVATDTLAARQHIGYLPEHNPLYKDMYIKEYLHFVAHLYQLPDANRQVQRMIDTVGLGREQHKQIGELSKGYRQRVGLAQALLHNPDVLILDEPTSGLDPNQLVEIRQLIKELGREKTVIFSTHIMQEVQAICDHVIIINKGTIVADEPIAQLSDRIRTDSVLIVKFSKPVTAKELATIAGVQQVEALEGDRWRLRCVTDADVSAAVFQFAVKQQLTLIEMQKEEYSVEEVFQRLTRG